MKIVVLKLDSEKKEWVAGMKTPYSYVENYERILRQSGLEFETLRFSDPDFWDKATSATHFIARFKGFEPDLAIGHSILPWIEKAGVKCMPDYNSFQFSGDKLRLAAFYAAERIPAPRTDPVFSMRDVEEWKKSVGTYPVVGKLRKGASSANVILIRDARQLDRIASRLFSGRMVDGQMDPTVAENVKSIVKRRLRMIEPCLLLQEFAPGNSGDHRVSVIGGRAFYFRRGNRPGDFRASGSGIFSYDVASANREAIDMALAMSREYVFPMMVYDFLTEPRPLLVEMNYAAVGAAIAGCPGYFSCDGTFTEHDGRMPQWYQLTDFLEIPDLKPVYPHDS